MSKVRILVVDDFAGWRQSIRSVIEQGTELQVVDEAVDGLEALHKAQELKPDLILLDLEIPHLNGIEVEHRLVQLIPNAKILFLSQNNDADVIHAALSNGAHGYVLKVDAGRELLSAITSVLQGGKFISSGVNLDGSGDSPTSGSVPSQA
jgi:two-component system nitrate/nitrite response regulator NarL